MKDQHRTGIRLFFIEFLIVLFFFLIISTICLKLFAASYQMTRQAEALSQAQTLAASVIETLEAAPEQLTVGETLQYFDSAFAACSEKEAAYTMTISIQEASRTSILSGYDASNHIFSVTVVITEADGTPVYTLSTSLHRPIRYKNFLEAVS